MKSHEHNATFAIARTAVRCPDALGQRAGPSLFQPCGGDGICIDPTSQTLCAPLSGVIGTLQDSAHAVSVTADNGVQVLMHIGLDTVNLAGKGFTSRVTMGQRVEAGQPLIDFDADYIALHARSLLTLMLVVSGEPLACLGTRRAVSRAVLRCCVCARRNKGSSTRRSRARCCFPGR